MSAMCIPGPSRSILRHLTHLPLTPRSHLAPAIPSYRYFSSTSIPHSDSRRQAYTLAQPLDSSSNGGFEGIPAAAYAGTVDTASSKGKGKEVDRHAAPEPPSPPTLGTSPVGERKRVIKAKKSAITMTPAAIERLRGLLSNPTPQLLRIGVKTRGCAGMAYHLDYVSPPGGKFDEVVEQDGIRVLIDSKALFSIIGSKMDWRDNRLSAGFVFDNPNIEDTCGCGESFNIRV